MADAKLSEDGDGSIAERLATLEAWMARINEWVAAVDDEKYVLAQRVQLLEEKTGLSRKTLGMLALVCCLFAGACGDNPTFPTVIQLPDSGTNKTTQPVPAPMGESTVTPPAPLAWWLPSGPIVDGSQLVWRVTVINAPRPFHVVTSSNHDDSSAGGGFIGRNGPNFRVGGSDTFKAGESGEFTLTFDTRDFACGRTQEDASRVWDDTGASEAFVGYVYRYGVDCTAPPIEPPCEGAGCVVIPPPSCTTPACVPTIPPPDPPPPSTVCLPNVTVTGTMFNGLAKFTVAPGHLLTISLVSYKLDGVHFLPQQFQARLVADYGEGYHEAFIQPAWPNRQEDVVCNEYPEGEDLTESNFDYWASQTIAGDGSQCSWCMVAGVRGRP